MYQAHDRTGDLNDAIPGGLDFLFANGINRNYDLSTMVKASAVGVMQEMVLRLGHAQTDDEAGEVWLALNLLIPVGLQMGADDATGGSSVPGSAMISSVTLVRSNMQAADPADPKYLGDFDV